MVRYLWLGLLLLIVRVGAVNGQTTAFTYQGQLTDGAAPANATYDLQFKLFDAASNGTQKGGTNTKDNVSVANGLFTVQLDFGAVFDGNARYLELGVRPGASTGGYQMLLPRQALAPAPYALFSAAPWVTNGGNVSFTNGNVGIGTASPLTRLHVASGASDILPPRIESSGTTGFAAGWDFYQGAVGKGYVGVPDSAADIGAGELVVFGGAGTKTSLWAGRTRSVTLDIGGRVGIGTASPTGTLTVRAPSLADNIFEVYDATGFFKFVVTSEGYVALATLRPEASTKHICFNSGFLSQCSSAAEYVPTVASDLGDPEPGDLVSIVGVNPYGDEHAPFAVGKSTQACDQNLVGFLLKPELSADGNKLNDHYLPLAIYGYFPAKVTLENGLIKRGDPITSSSKPGYGMKAISACKIIGYALEDADREGTIQVFAQQSESAAPEVAALRSQVRALRQENAVLAARLEAMAEPNRALEARLSALEQALERHTEVRQAGLSSSLGNGF
ncbi:MAG: hypothetical protein HYR72_16725 [Deltaproteobacteria bacterium]|nr:hypothetical protein [Deltaproteobacteria bacterium]MBI3389890.1 hypothetical protein [Deltaproteobacteria bacterium]